MGKVKGKKEPKNKVFKSPNTYVVLYAVIAMMAILTWFVPGGAYELDANGQAIAGTYTQIASNPQGLWDVLAAPIIGMVGSETTSGAIAISLFIMIFGSLLEMMEETSAIKIALRKVSEIYQNNMNVLIAILVLFMSILGTVLGAYEDGIIYLMMFIPVFLVLGCDTVVACLIVILGTQVGCLASVVNPFSVGIASEIAGISAGDGMVFRGIIFVVMTALTTLIICKYAAMVRKHPERSIQFFRREEDLKEFPLSEGNASLDKKQKGALVLFVLAIIIMIVALVPWMSLIPGFTFFADLSAWIAATPVLGHVLGQDITPLGDWYFTELSILVLVMTFCIGMIMKFSVDKTVDIIIKGAANLVPTALVVPLARGIQVIMDSGNITPTVLHFGETTLATLPPIAFVVAALLFYFVLACLIPSSTGLAAATMSIMGSMAVFANIEISLMVIIYSMALGLAKMITPCSIVVMTCTSAAHVSYTNWVKKVAPMVGILFVACCVFLVIGLYV